MNFAKLKSATGHIGYPVLPAVQQLTALCKDGLGQWCHFAMTDDIAERPRRIGGSTLRSISDISRHQHMKDNNDEGVAPKDMLLELHADNLQLTRFLRATHILTAGETPVQRARPAATGLGATAEKRRSMKSTLRPSEFLVEPL